jgi:tRNA (guanosine-2'-O-)-methyltransferase
MNPQDLDLQPEEEERLIEALRPFVQEERRRKISSVLAHRTEHLCVVLEDLFQPHNASAAMRSCECFGVQHIHVIENLNAFSPNREVDMGSSKWVTLHRHREPDEDNTRPCLESLKNRGYQIFATALREDSIPLEEVPVDRPFALCFGKEDEGLSPQAQEMADTFIRIPMFGFTQSFNISVSVALCLHHLTTKLRQSDINWPLSPAARRQLEIQWLLRSLRNPDRHLRHFLQQRQKIDSSSA